MFPGLEAIIEIILTDTLASRLDERYQSGKNRWFFTPLSKWNIKKRVDKG